MNHEETNNNSINKNEIENSMKMQQEKVADDAVKNILMNIMDAGARQRLNNIKLVKPELANNLIMYIAQLYQSGNLSSKLTEAQMVSILNSMNQKKETKITRK